MSARPAGPMERFRAEYLSGLSGPLTRCESRLEAVTRVPAGTLRESCTLTLAAGGKRLRPLLVLLSNKKGSPLREAHYEAAAAVELVHMATLVHDDVLDGADLRRGMPTLVSRYGPLVSAAAGDYLFAMAFRVLAETQEPRAISMLSRASLGLSMGELVQMRQARDFGLGFGAYEERCRLKTAGLFSASCCLGALLSGCSAKTIAAMEEFGRCLGVAFQIADDILDFAGNTEELGKRSGADLRDGTVTLPLILAMESDPSLADLLTAAPGDGLIDEICQRVRDTGALEGSAREAWSYVNCAKEALKDAGDEIEAVPLELIAEMAADRKV